MGAVGVGRRVAEGPLTNQAPVFNIEHWRITERSPMGRYFPPQPKVVPTSTLVDFYLKDGTIIQGRAESLDTDSESVVGITGDGRHFAVPLININYVLEVLPCLS